jgi:hypothetical protein
LEEKSNGSGQENRDYRLWESVALTTKHSLSAKVGTTSPTSGGRSVGIVRSRTKATEFSFSPMQSLVVRISYLLFVLHLCGCGFNFPKFTSMSQSWQCCYKYFNHVSFLVLAFKALLKVVHIQSYLFNLLYKTLCKVM